MPEGNGKPYPQVTVADKEEVWNCHWLTARSDIASEFGISFREAEEKLERATRSNPIKAKSVEFWLE